jgi:gas vesicle protein
MNRRDLGLLVGGFIVGAITGLAFREKKEMKEISPKEFFDMAKKNGGEASVTMKFKPAESEQVPQQAPVAPPTMAQYNQGELSEELQDKMIDQSAKIVADLRRKRDNGEEMTEGELQLLGAISDERGMQFMKASLEARLNCDTLELNPNELSTYKILKARKQYGPLTKVETEVLELLDRFQSKSPDIKLDVENA